MTRSRSILREKDVDADVDVTVFNRLSSPYVVPPTDADEWDFDAGLASDPDLAANGWTVRLQNSPWTSLTREGDIEITSAPAAGFYRSSLISGCLVCQFPTANVVSIYKATSADALTYRARVCGDRIFSNTSNYLWVANGVHPGELGTNIYYTGIENTAGTVESKWEGPSTFDPYGTPIALTGASDADTVKYIHHLFATHFQASQSQTWSGLQTLSRTTRVIGLIPSHAGIWVSNVATGIVHIYEIRRRPLLSFP